MDNRISNPANTILKLLKIEFKITVTEFKKFEKINWASFSHFLIEVPVNPFRASFALSIDVIINLLLGLDCSTNFRAACILGSMEPGANCPSEMYLLASRTLIEQISCWFFLLKLRHTRSTVVRIKRISASRIHASVAALKSLSITASTPLFCHCTFIYKSTIQWCRNRHFLKPYGNPHHSGKK